MCARAFTRLIFVTGTDTGIGKTTLTALLLAHLRAAGTHALAVKPFCSGDHADADLLRSLLDNELTAREVNPFFFPEPLAPLAAARLGRRSIPLVRVLDHIQTIARRCDCLLIEGVGGLLVPLGRDYTVFDLIARLRCQVLVVARNQLGTLNHTLLTVQALRTLRHAPNAVVLMQPGVPDPSSTSNPRLLAELLPSTPVLSLPFLGPGCQQPALLLAKARKLKRSLARILSV